MRCSTPIIRDVTDFEIRMEYIDGTALKKMITSPLSEQTGENDRSATSYGIIHGDLTTSNIYFKEGNSTWSILVLLILIRP